jgi:hypothetical protein
MRGILEVAGIDGFLENLDEWADSGADPVTLGWRAFVDEWSAEFGTREVRASDLVPAYNRIDDDFLNLGDHSEKSVATRLGSALRSKRGGVVNEFKLVLVRSTSGSNRYRLRPTGGD